MKDKEYRFYKLKRKLILLKERKVKSVELRLTKEQRTYLQELGYEMVPVLYTVRTKRFKNLFNIKNNMLKEIHYACKNGKKTISLKLTKEDMKILEEYSVKFYPSKFKILLFS